MGYELAACARASLPFGSLVRLLPDKFQRLFCLVLALTSSRKEGVAKEKQPCRMRVVTGPTGQLQLREIRGFARDEHLRQNCLLHIQPLISLRGVILLGL
jgi:hypothetical protein